MSTTPLKSSSSSEATEALPALKLAVAQMLQPSQRVEELRKEFDEKIQENLATAKKGLESGLSAEEGDRLKSDLTLAHSELLKEHSQIGEMLQNAMNSNQ